MSASQIWQHDAVGQAELIRSGDIAPAAAVDEAIRRAERLDPAINSIVHPRFEQAADDVATLTAGPFAGVPFAVKDWKCTTAGEPSTWAMQAFVDIDRRAEYTTELAKRYRTAGLVSIGRTNLPELAFGPPTTEPDAHGVCRNPWALDRSVGGSSGGAAAIVAAGIVPAANASDGGGSLRIPAACNGLVGLKVSRGRITNAPGAEGRGTKVEGHVARTVRDVAALLDATAGSLPGEPYALPVPATPWAESTQRAPERLRIGLLDRAPGAMDRAGDCGERNRRAVEAAAALLGDIGHVVDAAHPAALDEPLRTPNLYAAERAALLTTIEAALGRPMTADDVEPRTWAMFELAASSQGPVVIEELGREQQWARAVSSWWRTEPHRDDAPGYDLLLTPALGRDVPLLGELKETADDPLGTMGAGFPLAWFTYPFNATGHPAIVVPVLPPDDGVEPPTAVQLVAAHGREDLLLAVAQTLEDELQWPSWWPSFATG
ncbi:MAG: amidase [Actinomycetota bacterium]